MVNRVLLDLSGLDVSKAGVNVLTAGKGDLLFSSEWTHIHWVAQGVARLYYGAAKITVPYGVTFARPPYLDMWFASPEYQGGEFYKGWSTTDPAQFGTGGYMTLNTTSNLQMQWSSNPNSGISYYDVAYRVWGYATP